MNYLKATTAAAQAGVLHYVVGTYDSTTQNLYVDGELVATSEALSGAIEYAGTETLAFGCYLDSNEEFQMTGTIDSVKIRAKSSAEFLGHRRCRVFVGVEMSP